MAPTSATDGAPNTAAETNRRIAEVRRCRADLAYFCTAYCQILATADKSGTWAPFLLWPAQAEVARDLQLHREIIALKARQLGFTWLVIAFALQQLLFFPVATVLLFSKRDDEAAELLEFRLREMYLRLPEWMRSTRLTTDATHKMEFPGGSRVMAFATTGGRSYTATLAVIDEADYVPDLERMLNAIKPTIDAGGRLVLLSTVDKAVPESPFKRVYRAAVQGENSYHPIFHGWPAAPWRTPAWYAQQSRTSLAQTGTLDSLHQEYPSTATEALAPNSLDKRIPPDWIEKCYQPTPPLFTVGIGDDLAPSLCPAIPGLRVWALPDPARRYVVGADPAEGNPTSDDSALCVLDDLGAQVAEFAGKIDPSSLAFHADRLALWYGKNSGVMVERNNHGAGVLAWWAQNGKSRLLKGHDGKAGWLSNRPGKVLLYDACAEAFQHDATVLRSFECWIQLSSIEGATLRAPEGCHDDRADAYALAVAALPQCRSVPWKVRVF